MKKFFCVLLLFGSCFIFLTVSLSAEWQYIGNYASYSQEGSTVTFICDTAKVKLIVCTDDMVRVLLAPEGNFKFDKSHAVIKTGWTAISYKVTEKSGGYNEKNRISLRISRVNFNRLGKYM